MTDGVKRLAYRLGVVPDLVIRSKFEQKAA